MLNNTQCELARVMTNDTTSDAQIILEYTSLNPDTMGLAAKDIDKLVKLHNMPIDKCLKTMFNDFADVADKYSISPATLFCVYMDYMNKSRS